MAIPSDTDKIARSFVAKSRGSKGFGYQAPHKPEQTFSGILILTRNWKNPPDLQNSLLNNGLSGREDIVESGLLYFRHRLVSITGFCGDKI
jgi:hypothetical protein